MSEKPKDHKEKRERTSAKPWKRAFFRFDAETSEINAQEEEMERGLEKIYAGRDDLKEMQKGSSWWWVKWFVGISVGLLILSGLAWWGLSVLAPHTKQSLSALEVTIDGPESVIIGQETEYVVHWKNASFQTVQDAELRLGIPPVLQVTYMDPWPIDRSAMNWKLGLLGAGSEGKIVLRAIPFGKINDTTALQAVLTAPDQGAVDIKDALSTKNITMADSVIRGQWNMPPRVVAGDQVAIELALFHQGKEPLDAFDVSIQYPEAFVPTVSSTSANTSTHEMTKSFNSLASETTATVRVVGSFVAGASGDQRFSTNVTQKHQDASILLYTASTTLPVLASDLSLQVVANGSATDRTISPGDPVRVTLAYSNTSPDTLSDVSLQLAFESIKNGNSATGTSFLQWTSLDDANKGATSTKARIQTLTYDKKSVPALAALKPGDRGTIDITLPTVAVTTTTKDAVIKLIATGKVGKAGDKQVPRSVSTQPISLRYRSDAVFVASARYFTEEGAPLGSGPLPPVVGKSTTYRIFWAIDKKLHELESLNVTTTLPDNVVLASGREVGAGTLSFTTSTHELRWTLNRLPQDIGTAEVWFDVTLTPKALDSGRFASLTGNASFTATDSLLQESIAQSVPALTTDLEDDDGAKGKGVVKK
ncbi:MAG: hypothetical protein U0487_01370 [Patescibacteria group bacterium]